MLPIKAGQPEVRPSVWGTFLLLFGSVAELVPAPESECARKSMFVREELRNVLFGFSQWFSTF